jgi:hypothetical protein
MVTGSAEAIVRELASPESIGRIASIRCKSRGVILPKPRAAG